MVLSRLVLLVLVVSCPFDPVRAAEPPERLRDRAESLISGYGSGRNAAERDSIRTSLVEIASELEQAGESVLAARAHERAGILAFQSGDLVGAQERWAIGLDVARASGDPATEASLLNSRAIGVSAGGGLERGARLFEELVELRRSMGDVRGEGVTLTNLARARLQLFRLPEADAALRRAMACHREVGNIGGLAHTFQQRGQILLELGDVDGAIAMADSAIALALRSDDERVLGAGYADRGWFRQQAGDPATAIADLDRGLSILRELDDPRVVTNPRRNRVLCLIDLGRFDEALAESEALRSAAAARGDSLAALSDAGTLGYALLRAERWDEAESVLRDAIADLYQMQSSLADEASRIGLPRRAGRLHADLALCLVRRGRVAEAWWYADAGRAAELRRRIGAGEDPVDLPGLREELAAIDGQVLHFGDLTPPERVAFVVRPDTIVARVLQMPDDIGDDLFLAGELMRTGAQDALIDPVLDRLASALVVPLADVLDPSRRRLLVSLPKGFAGLPFETLPWGGGTVIDTWAVSEIPSASTFVAIQGRRPADGAPLALADPQIDPVDDVELEMAARYRSVAGVALPRARDEAARAAGSTGDVRVGRAASKNEVTGERASGASVLHFATHAVIDPIRPDGSALLLAGRGQDALLTAAEVEVLDLPADLVTLSGCRTAEGLPVVGEGTLGLSRAFLLAGARTVVLSRWDVEDEAAARFMELFYGALASGADRDEALREAHRTMRREGRPLRDRAAFVLAGVPHGQVSSILRGGTGGPTVVVVIAVGVGLLAVALAFRARRFG